ncbi:TPA: restriction endonuclease subunit S [Streptococcus suis]
MSDVSWQIKSLSELGRFSRGKSKHRPRNDKKLFTNGTYPLIQTGDIKNANLYVTKNSDYYNEFGLSQSKLWEQGTLCITIAANIAETAILSYPMCFPDSVVGFNAHKNESSELFVYYVFELIKKEIQKTSSGSIQDNINIDYLTKLKLKVPNKDYQDRIVNLLSTIDKKILINNQINEELEAMAKTLYDYWFVQFDFPDENGKPYKSSGGKMVYNDQIKREIPEGWGVENLSNFLTIKNGKDHKDLSDGNYPVYGSGGLMRKVEDYIFEGESVLIPRKGTLNNIMYVDEKFWTVDTMFYTHMKIDYAALYTYFSIKDIDFTKLNTGTGVPSMTASILYQLQILNPNADILKNFDELVRTTYRMIFDNRKQNQDLTQLRDWLLPMLMNGQVKVEE